MKVFIHEDYLSFDMFQVFFWIGQDSYIFKFLMSRVGKNTTLVLDWGSKPGWHFLAIKLWQVTSASITSLCVGTIVPTVCFWGSSNYFIRVSLVHLSKALRTMLSTYSALCNCYLWEGKQMTYMEPLYFFLFFKCFYWFEKRKERETDQNIYWLPPICMYPDLGPKLQPSHVPWLGMELATLWCTGQRTATQATPARAPLFLVLFESRICIELSLYLKNI